jgi:glycosyltransferase involved in cell wall biosynthesis
VLHIGDNLDPRIGGVYTTVRSFVKAAEGFNWQAICLSLDAERELRRDFPIESLPKTAGLGGHIWGFAEKGALLRAEELVSQADVIVVHSLYLYHTRWAGWAARKYRKPLLVVPHGGLDPYCFTYRKVRKRLWLRTFGRLLFRYATLIYASEGERRKAEMEIGKGRAAVISWPVADDTLAAAEGTPARRRPARLLMAGRLHPMKRVLETVTSFAKLKPKNCELVIAGPETNEIGRPQIIAAAGPLWERGVSYLGELPRVELQEEMKRCDGLLLFSHRENFGNVVAEAMAFGLPAMISSDVDIHGLVSAHGAGKVYPIKAAWQIDEALAEILQTPAEEWLAMSRGAAAAATQEFKFADFAAKVCELFYSVAGGAGLC